MTEVKQAEMASLRAKKAFLCDMDGVIYHGSSLIPGVGRFVDWLEKEKRNTCS